MKNIYVIIVFFFWFCSGLTSEAVKKPEFEFKHLTISDGLSQNTVMSIMQDKYGYMWFGTQDGLNRYDGKDFKLYKHSHKNSNSIISSIIRVMIETSDGQLWVGTASGGLSRFRRESNDFENYMYSEKDKNSLSGKDVFALFEDSKKNLWIGTQNGGLNKFNRSSKKFTRYVFNSDNSKSISSNMVRAIFEDSSGTLWVGNNTGGLNKFNPDTETFDSFCYSESGDMNDDKIITIFEYEPGILLIGTDGDGVKIFNSIQNKYDKKTQNTLPILLQNERIRNFYKDNKGVIWVATFGSGIITVKKNDKDKFIFRNYRNNIFSKTSLNNNQVLCIFMNKEGMIYFGTSGGGVSILDKEKSFFKNFRNNPKKKNSINSRYVRSVFEDSDGSLMIGTDRDGLNILKGDINYKLTSFGRNRIYSILRDSYGTLWVGTYGDGLYSSEGKTRKFIRYPDNENSLKKKAMKVIKVIFEDSDKTLWIGTQALGINKYNRKTKKFVRYIYDEFDTKSIGNNQIRSIDEDSSGNLWIGTWGGLNKFDKKKEEFLRIVKDKNRKNSLGSNHILSLHIDKNGIIWVGTWGAGLYRFDPIKEEWKSYTEADGFPNNVIYGILEEKSNKPDPVLWMSSNNGLIRLATKDNNYKVYDSSSGVQADEFNGGSFFQNKKGEMYFGGINGLTKFNPSAIKDNSYAPKVQISGIKVFNEYKRFDKPVEDVKEITFNYDENYFSIEFILLSYRSSNQNTYKYKLDGFDKDWIDSGKRNNAGYTNLEGGSYFFLVKGANNDGLWSNKTTALKINIIPPYWSAFWFKTIAFLLILLVLLLIYKLRVRKHKLEKIKLEKINLNLNKEILERKKVEEEKDKLQEKLIQSEKMEVLGVLAGGVAHDLNNILGAIVSYPDILLMKLPQDSPLRRPVLSIQQSGKKAAAVVKDLLTLARRGVKEKKIINLNNIIVELFKSAEFKSIKNENPNISFNFTLDEQLSNVSGSEIHISKSLLNLILNAVEAIKDDGQIFISTTNIEIKEDFNLIDSSLKAGHYAVFRILDNGEGIAKEDIKRIFEPFYTKKKMGRSGTGLGMAVIAGMVKDHNGEIDIWSEPGTGTSIDMYLPATKEKVAIAENIKLFEGYRGRNEKILVIDDVILQREIATMLLEQLNYNVDSVSSGEAGLEYLKNNSVDLVLLDMIMEPGIDGLTTYKKIIEINKDQKVIIVSGFSKLESIDEVLGFGVNSYIGKPYTIDILGKTVKDVLGSENIVKEREK